MTREPGPRQFTGSLWRELVELARLTPSPHNTQPWYLDVYDGARARLCLNHDRALPKEDVTGCFVYCAMGSFLEALRMLAANRGHRLQFNLLPESPARSMEPFADLHLIADESTQPEVDDALFERRQTSRLAPEVGTLTEAELNALQSIGTAHGQTLHHFTERKVVDRLMQLNLDAVIHDLNSRDYHDEIVSWFRFRERDAALRGDGLSAACMKIPPLEFFLFARLAWSARLPLLGSIVRHQYQRRLGPVPQLAALAGPFWDRAAATTAGACLMRLWLEMTRFGLYIHPFGNLVTNETAHAGINAITGSDDIWIVFRIGRTLPPPRSHRLPIEAICNA